MTEQDVIYFSGITLAILPPKDRDTFLRLIGNARKNDQQVIFDPNLRPTLWKTHNEMCDAIERATALSNLVMPSFSDEQDAFGDPSPSYTAHRYLALGCEEVVVKNADAEIIHRVLHTAETRFAPKKSNQLIRPEQAIHLTPVSFTQNTQARASMMPFLWLRASRHMS